MEQYNKKVLRHFFHPKNQGELKNPDGIGKVGNPKCGDVLVLQIKVGKKHEKEYIKDIKFKTLGCAAAIATSSVLTELAKGKTLEQADKIKSQDIVKALGNLPPIKYHCSLLGSDALKLAIKDFRIHHKSMNSDSSKTESFGSDQNSGEFRHARKPQKSKISDGYQNSERILKSKDFRHYKSKTKKRK